MTFKKAIVHIHTYHSFDCTVNPKKIVDKAVKQGIDYLLVTDHDSLAGSIEAANYVEKQGYLIEVPIAAEYSTNIGDLIIVGVPPHFQKKTDYVLLSTYAKELGGWTLLPHPFKSHKLEKIDFSLIDCIEVYNSRCTIEENLQALELACRLEKPIVYGSDAHTLADLNNAIFAYQGESFLKERSIPLRLLQTPWQRKEYSRFIKGVKMRKPKEVLRAIKRGCKFALDQLRGRLHQL